MSEEFVFVFGYQTDVDVRLEAETRWDWSSIGAFRIMAESDKDALEWGNSLAKWYWEQLRETAGNDRFAGWIETTPDESLRKFVNTVPLVQHRSFPDFSAAYAAFEHFEAE
ncbi:MAG TPA: hypothetical protein VGD79_09885 [Thermoanaerobaculia bacterium]